MDIEFLDFDREIWKKDSSIQKEFVGKINTELIILEMLLCIIIRENLTECKTSPQDLQVSKGMLNKYGEVLSKNEETAGV